MYSIFINYLRNEFDKKWVEQLKNNNNTNTIILLGNKIYLNTKKVISKENRIKFF